MKTKRAFTLVELLVVVAIIALLIAILLPTMGMFREWRLRFHCQTNLAKIRECVVAYAQRWEGLLPCTCSLDGIWEEEGINASPQGRFYKLEALKQCGAKATYFTCPAYTYMYEQVESKADADPKNNKPSKYYWDDWTIGHIGGPGTGCKYVSTFGYDWWIGADNAFAYPHRPDLTNIDPAAAPWPFPLPGEPDRLNNGRPWAKRMDEQGDPPIASDEMMIDRNRSLVFGFHHYMDREAAGSNDRLCEEPGGGGFTLFLSGAIHWYAFGELQEMGPGWMDRPASYMRDYYFGLKPPTQ